MLRFFLWQDRSSDGKWKGMMRLLGWLASLAHAKIRIVDLRCERVRAPRNRPTCVPTPTAALSRVVAASSPLPTRSTLRPPLRSLAALASHENVTSNLIIRCLCAEGRIIPEQIRVGEIRLAVYCIRTKINGNALVAVQACVYDFAGGAKETWRKRDVQKVVSR